MLGRPPVRCCPAALLLRPRGRTRLAAAAAVTGRASTVDGAEAPALRRRHLATGPPGPGQKSGWVEQGRSELRAIGAGFRLLGSNTVLSFRVLAASPKSPATSRDLYPGLLRELPSARKHLGQNVRDLAMIVPFVGLLCIPGTSIILPVVVAAFPGILPSTFPHGQRHRDADIAGVFRQLDKRATGRVDVNVCYQLIADLPPVDGAAAAGSKGTLSDADSGRLRTVLQRMDADGDGSITLEEFREWWLSADRPMMDMIHKYNFVRLVVQGKVSDMQSNATAAARSIEYERERLGVSWGAPVEPLGSEGATVKSTRGDKMVDVIPRSIVAEVVAAKWLRSAQHLAGGLGLAQVLGVAGPNAAAAAEGVARLREEEATVVLLAATGLGDLALLAERCGLVAPGLHGGDHAAAAEEATKKQRLKLLSVDLMQAAQGHDEGGGLVRSGSIGLRHCLEDVLGAHSAWTLAEDRLLYAGMHGPISNGGSGRLLPLPLTTAEAAACCGRRGLFLKDGEPTVLLSAWVGLTAGEASIPPLLLGLAVQGSSGHQSTAESLMESLSDGILQAIELG